MSGHDNDGNTPQQTPVIGYDTSSPFTLDYTPRHGPVTALFCQTQSDGKYITEFRVSHYDVRSDDADGYSTISTRDLPDTITAHELAQIIDMTIRAPNYVIKRDFPGVAHLFKPVEEA